MAKRGKKTLSSLYCTEPEPCLYSTVLGLCKGAPATSSHARAEWARPIEYRVGPIIIAVRARFGCHNALRWVPEQAESDVSGRSRRPTVPAECG